MDGPFLVQKFMKFWTMRLVGTKNGELLDYESMSVISHSIRLMDFIPSYVESNPGFKERMIFS